MGEMNEIQCGNCGSWWTIASAEEKRAENLDLKYCPLCMPDWIGASTRQVQEDD